MILRNKPFIDDRSTIIICLKKMTGKTLKKKAKKRFVNRI